MRRGLFHPRLDEGLVRVFDRGGIWFFKSAWESRLRSRVSHASGGIQPKVVWGPPGG